MTKDSHHWGNHVLSTSPVWLPSGFRKQIPRALLMVLPAAIVASGCTQIADHPKVVFATEALDDEALDSVSAGTASVVLNLSASASGPTATSSTQGNIAAANTSVLRVSLDPTTATPSLTPPRARLLSVAAAELIFAAGKAEASGASNAQCSATAIPVGDITFLTQAKLVTPISAICSCSAFVISVKP